MKKLFFLSVIFLTTNVFAQEGIAAKYGNMITGGGLKKHLTIIASDEFEGRETGTQGQRKAAAYIEKQFMEMGLIKAKGLQTYQQLYPLFQDSVQSSSLSVNGIVAEKGKDFLVPLANNSTGKFKSNKLIFAGYGIDDIAYNDYKGINVKGKIVVIFLGEPKKDGKYFIDAAIGKISKWTFPGLENKLAAAKAKGAIGVLVINQNMEVFSKRMIDNNNSSSVSFESLPEENTNVKSLNFALISHAFAKTLLPLAFDSALVKAKAKDLFSAKVSEQKMKIDYTFSKVRNIINASNVIGIIEGTDKKDEYVFLTGHYDHLGKHDGKIYYGADDDGSGTCGVIEMATAFAKAAADGHKPRRTMVFMTVSGEEKGLWGSEYYSDHPIYPLDKTSVDLNTDMVGRTDTERKTGDTLNYVYVVGHDKISSEMPIINEAANTKYTNLVLDYKFDDPNDKERIYYRSDHYNFARKGVPVLFFYDGMLKADYHKPTDTVDKINFELYEKRVRMIFYTAWEIANRDKMLNRDKPLDEGTR
jgi:Zn-dependent M28 family amino/carboxypeptidase